MPSDVLGGRTTKGSKRPNEGGIRKQALWPTPNAAKAGNDVTLMASGDGRETPNKLGWAVVEAMWPPPRTELYEWMEENGGRMLPTPTVQDGKNTAGPSQFHRNSQPLNVAATGAPGLKLSAAWVNRLMGYPGSFLDMEDGEWIEIS